MPRPTKIKLAKPPLLVDPETSARLARIRQKDTAADIKELKRKGVSLPFPGGDHRIRYKQSSRSHPSNRIKPEVIVHVSLIILVPIRLCVPFLRQLLFECLH